MGIPGGANLLLAAGGVSTYEIDQSLRFDSGNYLSRQNSQNGTSQQKWTYSVWLKRGDLGTAQKSVFALYQSPNNQQLNIQYYGGSDQDRLALDLSGTGTYNVGLPLYRDPAAWYHFVWAFDSTQATGSNRSVFYVNGEAISQRNDRTFSQNSTWNGMLQNGYMTIGRYNYSSSFSDYSGYMAECHFADGQRLQPSDFGEFNEYDVWVPKGVSGITYGNLGFYLKFDPSATNGIGHDHSGNGNNFTATGFTTSGTGTDVMSDTPTNNFPTYNPLFVNVGSSSATDGNLNVSAPNDSSTGSTMAIPDSGKYYVEFSFSSGTGANGVGIINTTSTGRYNNSLLFHPNNSVVRNGSTIDSAAGSWSSGDLIGLAIDAGAQTVRFYRNNSDLFGANQDFSSIDTGDGFHITVQGGGGQTCSGTLNFGQRAFTYTPPSGFVELCTANLPAPDIADGSQYFNTVLYTGNSASTQAITGVGFQPDFVWIKNRGSATDHLLFDAVRGVTKILKTVGVGGEETDANAFQSFNSDGFTLGTSTNGNPTKANGAAYVAWNWDAGGSGSSNTSGSITSTVSANPSAGFSIVTYTGAGSNSTVGHGLGVAPKMVWIKKRNSSGDWVVYTDALGPSYVIYLNYAYDKGGSGVVFGSSPTAPTSTVFSVGNHTSSGASGNTYVAHCFAEVEGYSKFGSYAGSSSSNGPFVYCGFKPAFLMVKNTSVSANWVLFDTVRNTYNVSTTRLFPNLADAEVTGTGADDIDILSNGFKPRAYHQEVNRSGENFIFMAFAEHPFGGDGVSPATAR